MLRWISWEREHVAGKPLVFGIHDFQTPMSMLVSRPSLPLYLYGYDEGWEHDAEGKLHIHPRKVATHTWGSKVIPSSFFELPGAENVSAVLFSNSGTISRFDRMGVLAGFGSPRVRLVREGFALDHDPNATEPRPFRKAVRPPAYVETWVEGLEVYHNPRAVEPLAPAAMPGAAHHRLLPGGLTESVAPSWHPLSSTTRVFVVRDQESTGATSDEGETEGS